MAETRERMLIAAASLTDKAEESLDSDDALAFARAAKELAEGAWWAGELKPGSGPEDGAERGETGIEAASRWDAREQEVRLAARAWLLAQFDNDASRANFVGEVAFTREGWELLVSNLMKHLQPDRQLVQGADPSFP